MKFVAIDVETANPFQGSICSIGMVKYENGSIVDELYTLIDPEDYFHSINVSIHGIDETDVEGSPSFKKFKDDFEKFIQGHVCLHHGHFDKTAIRKVHERLNLPEPELVWLDTCRVAQHLWKEMKNHKLNSICEHFGIGLQHHNALEDARACGEIMLRAIAETNIGIDEWLVQVKKPITSGEKKEKPKVNVNGYYYSDNETIVFTGTLSKKRNEYKHIASQLGLNVGSKMGNKTTILVVGVQRDDIKVSKAEKKAYEALEGGRDIKIIDEEGFIEMIKLAES